VSPGARPGQRPRKVSEYGAQLHEKQKVKAIYGVAESQFRRYFDEAARRPGTTGSNLLSILERRLDNVVYRLAFARSRPMARQIVGHGHILVNGRRVNIPSFLVKEGDVVTLSTKGANIPGVLDEMDSHRTSPRWIDRQETTGRITRLPEREDIDMPVTEDLIVEFYSR
jgi:small subunit ribosomal protein S4